jgi:hypothetical protein
MGLGSVAVLLWMLGCAPRATCDGAEQVLAEASGDTLTCGDADIVVQWTELLANRTAARERPLIRGAIRERFKADPVAARAWLDNVDAERQELRTLKSFEGAALRSEAVYRMSKGDGLVTSDDGTLWTSVEEAITVWAKHDEDRLALTESDIEGWINYGSLCREVQGGTTLRISVADRLDVYRIVRERWNNGTRAERIALAAMGPYWPAVRGRWQAASYDQQQAWIKAAPLPPPMTATSLGYMQAILEGDMVGHVATLHTQLGPLTMGF